PPPCCATSRSTDNHSPSCTSSHTRSPSPIPCCSNRRRMVPRVLLVGPQVTRCVPISLGISADSLYCSPSMRITPPGALLPEPRRWSLVTVISNFHLPSRQYMSRESYGVEVISGASERHLTIPSTSSNCPVDA